MQGEFRGDFTRNTYDQNKQFLRVLMQQGRVQLDADWNEQVSILLDRIQTLAKDIIGLHGGLEENCGFEFIVNEEQINNLKDLSDDEKTKLKKQLRFEGFLIGKGNYYVKGILCENNNYIPFPQQPNFIPELSLESREFKDNPGNYLVYLDVWERHVTHIEDYDKARIGIREVALGGADTATRSKLIWQVKLKRIDNDYNIKTVGQQVKHDYNYFQNLLSQNQLKPGNGMLRARATKPVTPSSNNSCLMPFNYKYRGTENQLYRVEIFDVSQTRDNQKLKFVWSRDNSSVVFPIVAFSTNDSLGLTLTLEHLKRGDNFGLSVGDWVEIVSDNSVLHDTPRNLLKVEKIDTTENLVILQGDANFERIGSEQYSLLRRWDSHEICVEPQNQKDEWITLENGIEVQFSDGFYQVGDYWLIPARTATGDIEWSKIKEGSKLIPEAQKPHGVAHHYAPLAIISVAPNQAEAYDCRHIANQVKFELNRVVNTSWYHNQVFEVSSIGEQGEGESTTPNQIFAAQSQDLTNLLTQLGLVIEFEKPVQVDSLHQRSVLLWAQKINASGSLETYLLPITLEAVEVKKRELKSIRWFIGNEVVDGKFNLITEVESLNNQYFTSAVRLILPKDWSTKDIFTKNSFSQLKVVLHSDLIWHEETLFDISNSNEVKKLNDGIISENLRQQFIEQGIVLSQKALLVKEKENLRWRLLDEAKMYVIRQENHKLIINIVQTLDDNYIFLGVPNLPSGKGSDWISVINIQQA